MAFKVKIIGIDDKNDKVLRKNLRQMLGLRPGNLDLYKQAFRHSTVANQMQGSDLKNSNERLEFLGDSILSAVVAEMVFLKFPFRQEGFLTQVRSRIVSRENLNQLARKMGIDQFLVIDKKNFNTPNSLSQAYGNALEAVIGAVYLDKGYKKTRDFIHYHLIDKHLDLKEIETNDTNYKSKLIEWSQRNNKKLVWTEGEPLQNGRFTLRKAQVWLDENLIGEGVDHVKKKAEQQAAEKACKLLNITE